MRLGPSDGTALPAKHSASARKQSKPSKATGSTLDQTSEEQAAPETEAPRKRRRKKPRVAIESE